MSIVNLVHGHYIFGRRVRVLAGQLAELLPRAARVLDVGSGDGSLAKLVSQERPDVEMRGIDVMIREQTRIPVEPFDGKVIPYADDSFDVVMFVDVLHHTEDPMILLREAARVARSFIVIKDHTSDGFFARPTLRLMDRVGNARHGVVLPYNYWSGSKWAEAFKEIALAVDVWKRDLRLYPWPAGWIFGRSLHFITRLEIVGA